MTVKQATNKRQSLQRSTPPQSTTPSKCSTIKETAEYICAICDALAAMSEANQLEFLTYLLKMAHAEAEYVVECN